MGLCINRVIRTFLAFAAVLMPLVAAAADLPRSLKAEVLFRLAHPCPATGQPYGECVGYVIDRIIPRVCGGAEDPANMQWQTLAEAREKDKWERIGCRPGRKFVAPQSESSVTEAYPLSAPPPVLEATPLPAK